MIAEQIHLVNIEDSPVGRREDSRLEPPRTRPRGRAPCRGCRRPGHPSRPPANSRAKRAGERPSRPRRSASRPPRRPARWNGSPSNTSISGSSAASARTAVLLAARFRPPDQHAADAGVDRGQDQGRASSPPGRRSPRMDRSCRRSHHSPRWLIIELRRSPPASRNRPVFRGDRASTPWPSSRRVHQSGDLPRRLEDDRGSRGMITPFFPPRPSPRGASRDARCIPQENWMAGNFPAMFCTMDHDATGPDPDPRKPLRALVELIHRGDENDPGHEWQAEDLAPSIPAVENPEPATRTAATVARPKRGTPSSYRPGGARSGGLKGDRVLERRMLDREVGEPGRRGFDARTAIGVTIPERDEPLGFRGAFLARFDGDHHHSPQERRASRSNRLSR